MVSLEGAGVSLTLRWPFCGPRLTITRSPTCCGFEPDWGLIYFGILILTAETRTRVLRESFQLSDVYINFCELAHCKDLRDWPFSRLEYFVSFGAVWLAFSGLMM
jgi:hypothetical protein